MAIRDTARRKLTYDDYVLFPDDGLRHEVLDGEHYVTPAPTSRHQGAAGALHRILGPFIYDRRLGRLFFASLDFLLYDECGIVSEKLSTLALHCL